jgi:Arc/MetJ-type ribon-helix-helix transcriptional regulator
MTIEIRRPELERRLLEQIESGRFRDVDEMIARALDALYEKEQSPALDESTAAAVRRLATFGERHGLSLGGLSVKELLNESRP